MSEDSTKTLNADDKLSLILSELQRTNSRLTALEHKVDTLDQRLITLEDKVDTRLKETRPIWESVLEELKEHRKILQSLERRFDVFSIEMSKVKGDVLDAINRIEDLERKPS